MVTSRVGNGFGKKHKQRSSDPRNVTFLDVKAGCLHACSVTAVRSDSLWPSGLEPTRLPCPWDSPGNNIRVGSRFLLQGIFLTQGLNPRRLSVLHSLAGRFFITDSTWEAPEGWILQRKFWKLIKLCVLKICALFCMYYWNEYFKTEKIYK